MCHSCLYRLFGVAAVLLASRALPADEIAASTATQVTAKGGQTDYVIRADFGNATATAVQVVLDIGNGASVIGGEGGITISPTWTLVAQQKISDGQVKLAIASTTGGCTNCEIAHISISPTESSDANLSVAENETYALNAENEVIGLATFSLDEGGALPGDFDGIDGVSDGELNTVLDAFFDLVELTELQQQNLGIVDTHPGDEELNAVLDAFLLGIN